MRPIIGLIIVIFLISLVVNLNNATNIETVSNCKVLKLQALQEIGGSDNAVSTDYRYIVVTDKETFICKTSILNNKYNNSDIFFRLQQDSTYDFEVEGLGKSAINDYRNILKIIKK